uniref:Uncharacterized protein n=1 Tax=Arundo donax TaxID=35708 RepID=A0A0A9FUD7_ARUDO
MLSNFGTWLRPLLQALKCDRWFDVVVVSVEVGFPTYMGSRWKSLFYKQI